MIEIRRARPDEHERIAAVSVAAYEALGPQSDEYLAELRDVAERAAAATVIVAVEGTALLGCVTYVDSCANPLAEFDDPRAASFRMLAVDPAAQGKGVGRLLVQECVDLARRSARSRLVMHTRATMLSAQRLYERMGFEREPSMDWNPGVELWGYALELQEPVGERAAPDQGK